jgi:Flp pilus assembly protein TadD
MKKNHYLLPLMASLPALFSCSTSVTAPALSTARIEPVMHVSGSDDASLSYYQLGRYYQGQNRLELAAGAYRKAIELSASYVDAHNALGTVYSSQGKFNEAIAELSTALKIVPDLARVYNNLGYTYFLSNNFSDAVAAYEKAIALEPRNPRAYNNLAAAYRQLGDVEKSRLALMQAEALTASPALNNGDKMPDIAANAVTTTTAAVTPGKPAITVATNTPAAEAAIADLANASRPVSIASTAEAYRLPTTHGSVALLTTADAPASLAEKPMPAAMSEPRHPLQALAQDIIEKATFTSPTLPTSKIDRALSKLFSIAIKADISYPLAEQFKQTKAFRLEIANGNGVTGLAWKVRQTLMSQGMPGARLTNIKPYQELQTVIQYRAAFQDQALLLSKKLIHTPKLVANEHLRDSADLRLILGKDVASKVALFGSDMEETMRLAHNDLQQ